MNVDGSNGTVDIIWGEEYLIWMQSRLNDGGHLGDTLVRLRPTVKKGM
jgi:hypothetical protein